MIPRFQAPATKNCLRQEMLSEPYLSIANCVHLALLLGRSFPALSCNPLFSYVLAREIEGVQGKAQSSMSSRKNLFLGFSASVLIVIVSLS